MTLSNIRPLKNHVGPQPGHYENALLQSLADCTRQPDRWGIQGASAIRNLLIRNVGARSAISWLGNRDPQLPRGHFRPLGTSPEKCERFFKFSVFQFSTFSPEVRTFFEHFEFPTFRSEEIGHPQRVSRVRKSGSRANSEVSYQTGDLYDHHHNRSDHIAAFRSPNTNGPCSWCTS